MPRPLSVLWTAVKTMTYKCCCIFTYSATYATTKVKNEIKREITQHFALKNKLYVTHSSHKFSRFSNECIGILIKLLIKWKHDHRINKSVYLLYNLIKNSNIPTSELYVY